MRVTTILTMFAGLVACGGLEQPAGEDLDVASFEGLEELKADYAGGRFVRVVGTAAQGRTKSGELSKRTAYHGYTVEAKSGDVLNLRTMFRPYMGLIAIYGPKKADGSWGTQVAKKWTFRPFERGATSLSHELRRVGTYLVVIGSSQIDVDGEATYALTRCRGECKPSACAEWTSNESVFVAMNLATRDEADWVKENHPQFGPSRVSRDGTLSAPNQTAVLARAGACEKQSKSCPRSRAPLCGTISGSRGSSTLYNNECLAKAALRDYVAGDLDMASMWAPAGGVCQ